MPTPNTMICSECGAVLNEYTAHWADGTLLCESCVRHWLQRNPGSWFCEVCGEDHNGGVESFTIEYFNGERKTVCRSCLDSWSEDEDWDIVRCERCGAFAPRRTRARVWEGGGRLQVWCNSCCREHAETCCTCGQSWAREEMWNPVNNEHYCPGCEREIGAWRCDACETWNSQDQATCEECGWARPRQKDPNLRRVMDYHGYTRHLHKKYVGRKVGSEEELYFGIELETSKQGNLDWNRLEPWIDNEESPKIHAEYDGSITGVEWISQPCTLKYWQEQFDVYGFCKALRSMGASAKSVARYPIGMHIHVTKRDALLPTLRKVDFYIHNEAELWKAISRRRAIYHCNEMWDCISNPKNGVEVKYGRNRYEPLNFRPEKTVELRTPRGTLDPKTILATIEWFHCVIKALEFVPIEKLEPKWIRFESAPIMKVTETTRDAVLPFLFANKDEYPHAVRMVTKILPRMRQYRNHPEMKRLAKKKAWLKDHKPGKKRIKKAKKVFVFTEKK